MENNDFISTTNIDLNTLWQDAMEEISKEVTALSFDVFIKSLEILDIKGNTVILATGTKDTKARLLKNYKNIIISACNKIYSAITNLEIEVKTHQEEDSNEHTEISRNQNDNSIENKSSGFRFDPKYTFDNYIIGGIF